MGYDLGLNVTAETATKAWQRLQDGEPELPADLCDLARSLGDVEPYDHTGPCGFYVRLAKMPWVLRHMADLGMLDTRGEPPGAPNVRDDDWADLAYYRLEGSYGISWWKLLSNDVWGVTAEECQEAVRAWLASDDTIGEASEGEQRLWDSWLGYLTVAAVTQGFHVS